MIPRGQTQEHADDGDGQRVSKVVDDVEVRCRGLSARSDGPDEGIDPARSPVAGLRRRRRQRWDQVMQAGMGGRVLGDHEGLEGRNIARMRRNGWGTLASDHGRGSGTAAGTCRASLTSANRVTIHCPCGPRTTGGPWITPDRVIGSANTRRRAGQSGIAGMFPINHRTPGRPGAADAGCRPNVGEAARPIATARMVASGGNNSRGRPLRVVLNITASALEHRQRLCDSPTCRPPRRTTELSCRPAASLEIISDYRTSRRQLGWITGRSTQPMLLLGLAAREIPGCGIVGDAGTGSG